MKIGFKTDTKDWQSYVKRVRTEYRKDLETLVARTMTDIRRGARQDVPFRRAVGLGGKLKSSIEGRVKGLTAEVWVSAHYAPYVEFGTGRLVFVPPDLKTYAMQFKGSGIREVNTNPQPYLYPHYFMNRDRFFEDTEKLFDKIK